MARFRGLALKSNIYIRSSTLCCLTIVIHKDGIIVTSPDVSELVRMAEAERLTLAEVISRELTPEQIDSLQGAVSLDLTHNFESISDFMVDVHVPSSDELLTITPEQEWSLRQELQDILSEDLVREKVTA